MGDDVQAARSEATVKWLSSEVRDFLDVGAVGLYEFIWALRSGQPGVKADDRTAIAESALRQLLVSEPARLILLTWPHLGSGGDVELAAVRASDWDDPPEDGTYVALKRD
jgi:nitrogen fixation-related uncharacterized protein